MHRFSISFDEVLSMFRTGPLSIIRSMLSISYQYKNTKKKTVEDKRGSMV